MRCEVYTVHCKEFVCQESYLLKHINYILAVIPAAHLIVDLGLLDVH